MVLVRRTNEGVETRANRTAVTFEVGDFVFVQRKSGCRWIEFFGYVAAINGEIYSIAPSPRWNNGNPYVTEDTMRGNLMRAVYSFAGPVRIGR
jgi:hypothetical protein